MTYTTAGEDRSMSSPPEPGTAGPPPSIESSNDAPDDVAAIRRSLVQPEEFAVVFDRHGAAVLGYIVRRLGPDEAEDVLSEVFFHAFRQRERFAPDTSSARPWLLGIATNLIRRKHRSEVRRYRAQERSFNRAETNGNPLDGIESAVDAARAAAAMAHTLAGLSRGERDVLLLFAYGELSYLEIADALQIAVGTVRSRLSRARATLKANLTPILGEGAINA